MRTSLWLASTPGFWSKRKNDFLWECMCDTSRLVVPHDYSPRNRRQCLKEMRETLDKNPCHCAPK